MHNLLWFELHSSIALENVTGQLSGGQTFSGHRLKMTVHPGLFVAVPGDDCPPIMVISREPFHGQVCRFGGDTAWLPGTKPSLLLLSCTGETAALTTQHRTGSQDTSLSGELQATVLSGLAQHSRPHHINMCSARPLPWWERALQLSHASRWIIQLAGQNYSHGSSYWQRLWVGGSNFPRRKEQNMSVKSLPARYSSQKPRNPVYCCVMKLRNVLSNGKVSS